MQANKFAIIPIWIFIVADALHRDTVFHNNKHYVIKIRHCIVYVGEMLKAAPIDVCEKLIYFIPISALEVVGFAVDVSDVLFTGDIHHDV